MLDCDDTVVNVDNDTLHVEFLRLRLKTAISAGRRGDQKKHESAGTARIHSELRIIFAPRCYL